LSLSAGRIKTPPDRIEAETNWNTDRRPVMPNLAMDFETGNEDVVHGENDRAGHERTRCLQFVIAYLLERNEKLRMQLIAKRSEESA
jgi:hypothetical protein